MRCTYKSKCTLYISGNADEHACNHHAENCIVYKELSGQLPDEVPLKDDDYG